MDLLCPIIKSLIFFIDEVKKRCQVTKPIHMAYKGVETPQACRTVSLLWHPASLWTLLKGWCHSSKACSLIWCFDDGGGERAVWHTDLKCSIGVQLCWDLVTVKASGHMNHIIVILVSALCGIICIHYVSSVINSEFSFHLVPCFHTVPCMQRTACQFSSKWQQMVLKCCTNSLKCYHYLIMILPDSIKLKKTDPSH